MVGIHVNVFGYLRQPRVPSDAQLEMQAQRKSQGLKFKEGEGPVIKEEEDEIIRCSHILLKHNAVKNPYARDIEEDDKFINRDKKTAVATIKGMYTEIHQGRTFDQVAKVFSECTSGPKGGDLGLIKRGEMPVAFDDAAFRLKVDELSEIIETDLGFHIILRTE